MHIAYLDESGDLGAAGSPTRLFILSGLLVPHERWIEASGMLENLRASLRQLHGLRLGAEIHASQFLGGAASHLGLDIPRRFQCAHHILRTLRETNLVAPVRIAVRKDAQAGKAVLDVAWDGLHRLIAERLVRTHPPACGGRGLVVVMDHHGALPYRPASLGAQADICPLLELPFGRRSEDSHFLQCADLLGFLTKQSIDPNGYFSGPRGRRLIRLAEQLHPTPCPILTAK